VADSSASEGILVDDSASIRLTTHSITVPLVGDRVACPVCEEKGINLFFMSLSDLNRHLDLHHIGSKIRWSCLCGKSFPKLHGTQCHIPKCSGTVQKKEEKFKCEACPMSFGSQRGLSTHERHAHPALRNQKRRGTDPPNTSRIWTEVELSLLRELNEKFKNHKHPNIEISAVLTNKSIDQIKYQRKKLKLVSEEMSSQETAWATEGGCDLVDPGNASSGVPETHDDHESPNLWRLELEKAILAATDVPPVLSEVHDRLIDSFILNQGDKGTLTKNINECIAQLYGVIKDLKSDDQENIKHNKHQKYNRKNNRNAKKRFLYARCQDLFNECPKKLADVVINDDRAYLVPARQPPAAAEIQRYYKELWGQQGPTSVPSINTDHVSQLPLQEYFSPVTVDDVVERIKRIRKKAAAGPDGLLKEHLLIPGLPIVLTKIYNICLYTSYYPSLWKNNRTTLIPKPKKPDNLVENWRPITIGPILGRIFSSILDRRLRRGIVLNARQKGFTSENGCKINIELLNSALNSSKRENGGTFTIVDVSKAFDTIPHSALTPCLARKGVPAPIIELVNNMYQDNFTTIRTNDNEGVEIKILRGVKQGDPLSPLLFNLCLEPLLETIEENTSGIKISSNQDRGISILAFADDIVLLGANEREAQFQVDTLHKYLDGLKMKLSREKSQTFQVVSKRDTWYVKDPDIKLEGLNIPAIDPDEAFKYLGAKMGPWKGVHCGIVVPEILGVVRRVRKLSLKPCQKIELIVKYVFPRYIYHLLISPPSDTVLKLLDSEVRQEIKAILHLVPSTATGFFYAPKNRGGLGIPRFEHIIKLGILKSAIKMNESIDPAVSGLINIDTQNKLKRIANSLRINWPASLDDIEKARKNLKGSHIQLWGDLRSQGQGVPDFSKNKTGNVWLKEYNLLRPSRFIDALRLRTNTFGTRTVLARVEKNLDVLCRRCRAQPETLGHILGLCQYTKGLRIKRHDEAKLILADTLQNDKRNEVFVEPTLKVDGDLYKPDLVVKNEDRVLVVDVTVRYENKDYLSKAEREKVDKYQKCTEFLKKKFNVSEGLVLPVVLGSRGVITPKSEDNLKLMGVSKSIIKTIVLNVLRSSIEMCNIFLDN
jgi:hypothetical protein